MKKLLGLTLCALMGLSLVACGEKPQTGTDQPKEEPMTFTYVYSSDVQSLDYVTTALAVDHEINANLVDGLLENDNLGHFVGALAESWETNEDASVWTFHIREGVKWVTSTGEEYADVTAHDFVTGLQHAADFESGTAWLLDGVVKNFFEYESGLVDFSEVGVKALDDYTLQYTLEGPTPYFHTMTTYTILYPVNKDFLLSKGEGCALGAPDKETCAFGTVDPTSILYNGGYILTKNDAKSVQELTKNEAYWDADNIFVEKITLLYDDGSDVYSVIKGFEQGTYQSASLSTVWEDFDSYKAKYADNYYTSLPNSTCFGTNFNYNRVSYEYTSKTTDEERANAQAAILNANFRRAYMAAFDRVAYLEQNTPTEVAIAMLRNMNQFPDVVSSSEGTYTELVNKHYAAYNGEAVNLADGQDPFLSKEKALKYIDAAKAEGIKFPVRLDVLVIGDSSPVYVNRANSMKKSVEENTDGQIIIDVQLQSTDTVYNICYYNTDPAAADYDINTFSGWGPDYADPKSFVDIYSTTTGYYMTTLGLDMTDTLNPENNNPAAEAAKEAAGFVEYERLYREADAITTDLDARYDAFAKADAYLVHMALMVPQQMQARGYVVSKIVPFSRAYSSTGVGEYKYKFMKVQDEIVTKAQYDAAKAEWDANR